MVKKFSFNFSFLDRFKKKPKTSVSDHEITEDEVIDESPHEIVEMKIPSKQSTQFKLEESEFESAESSEVFAEQTLSNFKIPDLKNVAENNHDHHLPDHHEEVPGIHIANHEEIIAASTEKMSELHEKTDRNINFQEMQPPAKPAVKPKFNFHFPTFKTPTFGSFKGNKGNLKNSFQKIEKLSWNEIVLKIFSPYSRPKIHNTFLVLFVITLTYLFGKSIAMFTNRTTKIDIKPKSNITIPADRQDSAITDIGKITSTNLFNAKETEEIKAKGPKINIADIVCVEANKPTSMQIKLLDTIVLQDSVKSVASVQLRGASELLNIREGEKVDNAEISKIGRMKLILKNLETGDCEYLASEREDESMAPSPIKVLPPGVGKNLFKSMNPNIKNEGNNFKIKRKYRDELVTKMSEVLTQAKAIQLTNPDGSLCFKMTEIVPGSVYSSLNIQENDVICQINGRKIDNLNELMGLLGRIKEIDAMQIGLKRNGMQENLDYSFEL